MRCRQQPLRWAVDRFMKLEHHRFSSLAVAAAVPELGRYPLPSPMSIAPEPILRAGSDTVAWACIFCRNQTLRDGAPTKMINDTMEAIHEVPRMLVDWDRHDLAEVRMHLATFPASR
jgi:hypothetical protein